MTIDIQIKVYVNHVTCKDIHVICYLKCLLKWPKSHFIMT